MKLWDILILAAVAAGVFFAVRFLRKGGGCCGDCEKCRGCHKKGGGGC